MSNFLVFTLHYMTNYLRDIAPPKFFFFDGVRHVRQHPESAQRARRPRGRTGGPPLEALQHPPRPVDLADEPPHPGARPARRRVRLQPGPVERVPLESDLRRAPVEAAFVNGVPGAFARKEDVCACGGGYVRRRK